VRTEEKKISLEIIQDGLCLGIIQWLKVRLYEKIEYENRPGETNSHWPTPIYLFEEPVSVRVGDVLEIRAFLSEDSVWFYRVS